MRLRRWWVHRTLGTRITIVIATVALLVFGVVAQVTSVIFVSALIDQLDGQLRATLSPIAAEVSAGKQPTDPLQGHTVRVLNTAGAAVDDKPALHLDDWRVSQLRAGEGISLFPQDKPQGSPVAVRWIGSVVTTPEGVQRLVIVGTEFSGYLAVFQRASYWFLPGAILSMIAVAGTAWLAVRLSLRPVRRMREAAGALPTGQRLPVPPARDELRALAEELNALLARRDDATERMRRFSGDAAHELRSPVAALRMQAEVAVAHPDPELAQETLADIAVEAERLSELVDDLLLLARSDNGELPPAESIDLAMITRQVTERFDGGGISVYVEAPTSVHVLATEREVELVLNNLLRNAVRYAQALVRVVVLPMPQQGRLLVEDDGPGVPSEHREHIFDRFYRLEESRDRTSGGTGLGLALVADVVRRRGGSVNASTSPEGGARFDARWPTVRDECGLDL